MNWGRIADAAAVLLAALTVYGLVLVVLSVSPLLKAVVLAVAALLVILRFAVPEVARPIGALVVPVLGLLGANGVWAAFGADRPGPIEGLVIASVFVLAAVVVYLHSWLVGAPPSHAIAWTIAVVVLLVAVPPAFAYVSADDEDSLPKGQPVSRLDVVLVGDAAEAMPGVTDGVLGWDVRDWAGQASGETISWRDGIAPRRRERADAVLLLLIDGSSGAPLADDAPPPPPGEVDRWLAIADAAAKRDTPTFVLLRTTDPARVARWRARLAPLEGIGEDDRRHGAVLTPPGLPGSRHLGERAVRFAAASPTADEDLALAAHYRPQLFFDEGEPYSTPFNVDSLLSSGALSICPNDQPLVTLCDEVRGSTDLWNGSNHLAFDTETVAQSARDSAIYVHVKRHPKGAGERVYLDYWWYLPDNPTYAAGGALCGAGFVIAGITCFDHQSDWEGVTVVVDPESSSPAPVAVHYAAHNGVVRYPWPVLREVWAREPTRSFAAELDTSVRPLVFVALGSHASYPVVCERTHCDEPGAPQEENGHDGGRAWSANPKDVCRSTCLRPLPVRNAGKGPARWNAYEGPWGTAHCELKVLCSSSKSPLSPSQQKRYAKPWCSKLTAVVEQGRHRDGTCPDYY